MALFDWVGQTQAPAIDWVMVLIIWSPLIIIVAAVLIREVLLPYRKRDWSRAAVIGTDNHIAYLDVKPKVGWFSHKDCTYVFPKETFIRKYKLGVKPLAFFVEGIPEAISLVITQPTKPEFKAAYAGETVKTAIKGGLIKQLLTPTTDDKEKLIFILLGILGGIGIMALIYPSIYPCPVC